MRGPLWERPLLALRPPLQAQVGSDGLLEATLRGSRAGGTGAASRWRCGTASLARGPARARGNSAWGGPSPGVDRCVLLLGSRLWKGQASG